MTSGGQSPAVARQYIIADLKMEDWQETDHIPKDEQHY